MSKQSKMARKARTRGTPATTKRLTSKVMTRWNPASPIYWVKLNGGPA